MSQQTAAPASSTTGSRRSSGSKVLRFVVTLMIVLALLGMGWLWIVTFGAVVGEEFSPQRFQRRTFTYYQIPLLGIQIRPIVREAYRGNVEKFLVNNKYVQVTASAEKARWDLLHDSYHRPQGPECDAAILSQYLDATLAQGGWFWEKWTKDHPKQAKVFWPAVAELAREQMYIFLPELIEVARQQDEAANFNQLLGRSLADSYCVLARAQQQEEHHQRAIELYGRALKHDAEHVDALRGRAESLRSVGENEKAAGDLAEANRIEKEGN
jgi:tetratricopeptide (TPR) repeat protein